MNNKLEAETYNRLISCWAKYSAFEQENRWEQDEYARLKG